MRKLFAHKENFVPYKKGLYFVIHNASKILILYVGKSEIHQNICIIRVKTNIVLLLVKQQNKALTHEDDSNTNSTSKITDPINTTKKNARMKMKPNDVREQSTNNEDDKSFVTANNYTTNCSDSQSLLRYSLRKTILNEPPSSVAFGQKQISHMKLVLKDNQINNDDTLLETTTPDDYTKHSTTSKVNRITNINEEKKINPQSD